MNCRTRGLEKETPFNELSVTPLNNGQISCLHLGTVVEGKMNINRRVKYTSGIQRFLITYKEPKNLLPQCSSDKSLVGLCDSLGSGGMFLRTLVNAVSVKDEKQNFR